MVENVYLFMHDHLIVNPTPNSLGCITLIGTWLICSLAFCIAVGRAAKGN